MSYDDFMSSQDEKGRGPLSLSSQTTNRWIIIEAVSNEVDNGPLAVHLKILLSCDHRQRDHAGRGSGNEVD